MKKFDFMGFSHYEKRKLFFHYPFVEK